MMARQIGITPPSSRPMNSRAEISTPKFLARPETNEQSEKPMTQMISSSLREPVRSDSRPTR